jgi:hypothetical protein
MHKNDCHFDYHEIPNIGPNVVFTGFFQSWKYFKDVQDEVRKVFELPHATGYEDFVSIHVRRGDYLQHSGSFPPIDELYIYRGMDFFITKTNARKFIFFSDDIQWCKDLCAKGFVMQEQYSGEEVKTILTEKDLVLEFSEGRNAREDLSLMASCGHHIIANSTFSYWGAYLGHNPDRVVISPYCVRGNWFGMEAGVKRDVVDLLPPEWHQIKFR